MQSLLNVFDNVLKLHLYPAALPEHESHPRRPDDQHSTIQVNHSESTGELSKLSQYAVDALKIVKIEKHHEPLGLTVSRTDAGSILVARIVIGGIAANTQLFQINDRILEINDEPMTGHTLDHVCSLMSTSVGLMKFLLAPPLSPTGHHLHSSQQAFHVRALYAYDPLNDPMMPCKELGLSFQRGDILRIVAREDNPMKIHDDAVSWWQAYRENATETDTDPCLAGLIPSDSLQQKRAALLKAVSDETESLSTSSTLNRRKKRRQLCFTCMPKKRERKSSHSVYNNSTFQRDIGDAEAPTIRTSTNHFSLTDTRQFGEEQPSAPTAVLFADETKGTTVDASTMHSFRFYEPIFRLDLSTQPMTRPIILLGKP